MAGGGHGQHSARGQGQARGSGGSTAMSMTLFMSVPWLMFTMISMIFSFAYHHYYFFVWVVVIAWAFKSFAFMAINARMKGNWFMFLGWLCLAACIFGSLSGLYNYYTHMFQYWSYDENRSYTNVLPTEPAASHADAGKMIFANSARVDTTRAVGYKVGSVYCVAPILDDSQIDRVEYWAAGIDCCPARGDFNCDDAWNPKAKSGVVILDSNALIPTRRDYFMKAAKEAESAYQIAGSPEPIFVRWVSDPQGVQDDYWRKGVGYLVATACFYLLVSIVAGAICQMSSRRTASAESAALP